MLACGDIESNPGPCSGRVLPFALTLLWNLLSLCHRGVLASLMVGFHLSLCATRRPFSWPPATEMGLRVSIKVWSCHSMAALPCAHTNDGAQSCHTPSLGLLWPPATKMGMGLRLSIML